VTPIGAKQLRVRCNPEVAWLPRFGHSRLAPLALLKARRVTFLIDP